MTEDAGGWTTGTADSPQGPEHAARQALRVRTWAPPSVATVLMVTLGLAAASWVLAIQLVRGMDPGVAPEIGSFAFFMTMWVTMMAAMTLPGAIPAVLRGVRATGRLSAGARFVASYLAVWALVGVAVYPLNRPPGTLVAGALAIAAGIYELTPFKRFFRRQCREGMHSALQYGLSCVGSSIGPMLIFVALSVMSILWMSVIAIIVLAQKLLPPKATIDVPVGLAIVGLGLLILIAPSLVPGLQPM
jgi:predicted metal-binding membrane protein